jgi:hypothetical protein
MMIVRNHRCQEPEDQLRNNFLPGQAPYNAFSAPIYTAPPVEHEPGSDCSPSKSSMISRSGDFITDPTCGPYPVNYGHYQNFNDVQLWTETFTDPTSLISPSEHRIGNFFNSATHNVVHQTNVVQQTMPHRSQINIPPSHTFASSPIEPQWPQSAQAEPSPDRQGFVNYDASSSLFTDSYVTEHKPPPSSPGNSSMSHFPHSPYQQIASPSAVSPGSSRGVFSFHSDQAMMIDPFPVQAHFLQPPQPSMAIQTNYTPIKNDMDAYGGMLEPESATSARNLATNGGRALGTRLEPEVDMRKISACWHCVIQRDKCSDGEICARCLNRSQRPNADCGLGCVRMKLVELSQYFLPPLVTQMHEDSHLKHFVNSHVHGWGNQEFTLHMTCGD